MRTGRESGRCGGVANRSPYAVSMGRRGRTAALWVAIIAVGFVLLTVTPAWAESMPGSSESLSLSVTFQGYVHEPVTVTASGIADGSHHLVVYGSYVDEGPGGKATCAAAHSEGAEPLTPSGGEALPAGAFERRFVVTPTHECDYFVSAYLEAAGNRYADAWAFGCVSFWEETSPGQWSRPSCSVPVITPGALRSLEEQAQKIGEEAAAQRAKRAEEAQIAQARAEELAAAERAAHEPAQHSSPPVAHCHVPALVGHTLLAARRLLKGAGCKLGHVKLKRGRYAIPRVRRQSVSPHEVLATGTAVAITLVR